MKIGVVTFDFYPIEGGQGRHIYEIYYKKLKRERKIDIKFITPCRNSLKGNFEFFHWTKKIGKNILYSFLINLKLKKIVEKNDFDLLNVHCGPGGLFLFKKPKTVTIIATSHHTYYQQSQYIRGQKWKRIFIPFEKRTYLLADKIIAVSESTKKVLIRKYNIPSSKIEVIPNGVNLNKFKKMNTRKIPKSLFFVGRLDRRKGIPSLLNSLDLLVKEVPGIKLYIAGRGKLKGWIKKFSTEKKLENNIQTLGFVSDSALNQWYNKVEVVVIPSIFEGFGFTILESMAAGTPVITSNTSSIPELIRKGVSVDPHNVNKLAKKTLEIITDKRMRNKLSFNGIKYAKKYNWEGIANETYRIFERERGKEVKNEEKVRKNE